MKHSKSPSQSPCIGTLNAWCRSWCIVPLGRPCRIALVPILLSISCISYVPPTLTRGRENLSALLLQKYANVTLSNATRTVASLLPVCLSIFGLSLLLNIQYDDLSDMSWLEMTGSVETVDNEENARTHARRHTHECVCMTQWDPCCPAGRLQGELVCCSSLPKKCQQVKAQTALEAHVWSAFCGGKHSVVYLTASTVCCWGKERA